MTLEANILILLAHPERRRSRINHAMAERAAQLPGVRVHDLYENYPEFFIDTAREQAQLQAANLVVFQFPLYWFRAPALLQQWQESVLQHGFGYGVGDASAVSGKDLMLALSTGAPEMAYLQESPGRQTIPDLMSPYCQMARLCGMNYLDPLVAYDSRAMDQQAIDAHAECYAGALSKYASGFQSRLKNSRQDKSWTVRV